MLDHALQHGFYNLSKTKNLKLFLHSIIFMDLVIFLKKLNNKALSKVDHIVAISEFVRSKIIDTYKINKNKITVINRGIDTKFLIQKILM